MRDSLEVEIVRVRQENPEVKTLYFARPFDFTAGQYITVLLMVVACVKGRPIAFLLLLTMS